MRLARPLILIALAAGAARADTFPPPVNTQNPKDTPPTAQEAAKMITAPPGFRVTLFAGDPDVMQPIAMTTDDRGRLWVAESYTYSGKGGNSWDQKHRDRVLIFEDEDNDGTFDSRKVFWDQARNLSGIATGFGGVWLLCAPELLFIPDRDGDDRPDGPPEVKLDGWNYETVGHNIVNGLTWGPDGWLYGRHGITSSSLPGTPDTPPEKRKPLNCGIWRYHPTRKVFETVCNGTTNPWGFDYDDHGEMFFTNNVIGHLWHVIPGAHYKRMFGEDFDPRLYEYIDQHADHYHWDAGKNWTDSRDARGEHGKLGGGHSHCGGMIYLGDNWPAHYRNTIFMCNTHGRRVNNDRLVRQGSGYVGLHQEDFLFANNPWFRGTSLKYGPDGGVYVSDWVDFGECHDHDGVHRTSGRIYKVVYREAKKPKIADVARLSNAELVRLQLHANDWFVRAARRLLQERAHAGQDMKETHAALQAIYKDNPDVTRKLRAMWALYVTGGLSEAWLLEQLGHEDEHVRSWAVRLLVDEAAPSPAVCERLARQAREEQSGLVRLYLTSALQRIDVDRRMPLAVALLSRGEDVHDHNLPLMGWYGIIPLTDDPGRSHELFMTAKSPLIRLFLARRYAEQFEDRREWDRVFYQAIVANSNVELTRDLLQGMARGLRGRRKVEPPAGWSELHALVEKSGDKKLVALHRELSVVFGDGRTMNELRAIAQDANLDGQARRDALRLLIDGRDEQLPPILKKLIGDRATASLAAKGLATFDDPETPGLLIGKYRLFQPEVQKEVIATLSSRKNYAEALLRAVERGQIPAGEISAFHARQIQSLKDDRLSALLARVWGEVRGTPAEKKKLLDQYRRMLNEEKLKGANLSRGRLIYQNACANCHRLYGEGEAIGPDLTGSGRDNLDYLLENLVDPSAVVPNDFRMSAVTLKNGRVLTGVLLEQTPRTITVQGQKERVVVERAEVEEIIDTKMSLMPDGLLTPLKEDEVRDLIAYLRSRQQVPLP